MFSRNVVVFTCTQGKRTSTPESFFPSLLRCQEIDVGYVNVRAARITYMGELGWELYVPTESATAVYDTLFAAAAGKSGNLTNSSTSSSSSSSTSSSSASSPAPLAAIPLKNAGYFAIDSLRVEKGYISFQLSLIHI